MGCLVLARDLAFKNDSFAVNQLRKQHLFREFFFIVSKNSLVILGDNFCINYISLDHANG